MEEAVQCDGCDGSWKAAEDGVSGGVHLERRGDGENVGLSGKTKVSEAKKEKRRPRLILIDTDSDEDLVSPPQKVCHAAHLNGKEGGDSKKYSVMDRKRDSDDSETQRRKVIEKLWRSRMNNSNGDAQFNRKKMNTGASNRKRENIDASGPCVSRDAGEVDGTMHKVLVTERKRCKPDSSTFKQKTELCRKKTKTESGKSKEEACGLLESFSSRKDAEFGRILGTGNERKRNRVDSSDLHYDDDVVQKNIKIENWKSINGKTKFKGSRPLDPRLKGSTTQWKETESKCGKGPTTEKVVSRLHKKGGTIINSRETECFDKKKFRLNKNKNFHLAGASKDKFRASCDKIRVQGKSGVLKLSSKNKTKGGGLDEKYNQRKKKKKEKEKGSWSPNNSNRKVVMDASGSGRSRFHEDSSCSFILSENHLHLRKGSTIGTDKASGSKTEDDCMTLHWEAKSIGTSNIKEEEGKSTKESSLELEIPLPTRERKIKKKEGVGREKKLLCEQIKHILLHSGWSIDYRPRKSRDYKDAVYIAPSGTEHWSITKAYYAFQEQLKCEGSSSGNLKEQKLYGTHSVSNHKITETEPLLPVIPEELLSILKRNRVKKKSKGAVDKNLNKGRHKNVKKASKTKFIRNNSLKVEMNSSIPQVVKLPNEGISENGFVRSSRISLKGEGKLIRAREPSFTSDASLQQGRKNKNQRGSALLARSASKGVNTDADDFVPYPGKRTLLSWLIDLGTVCENAKVEYLNKKRNRAILKGWITRDGIHCSCCSKILSASKFEIHAGSKLSQPFENIFVEMGDSLLQCMLDAWGKEEAAEQSGYFSIDINGGDPNDDTCGICGDGGDLICCDSCPSTFHQCCLNMEMLPPGDWHCSNCSCRFCGGVVCSTNQNDGNTVPLLFSCSQCEGKYHPACVPEMDAIALGSDVPGTSFCGNNCRKLHDRLQKLLGVRNNLDAGFSWMLVRCFDKDSTTSLAQRAVCNSKVAVAAAVMDECFFPIIDQRSGANMVQNVLYNRGSNFNRLNYSSFYTVVLERGDEIVSAASIRIRGTRLVEMPFIGTRDMYRRQGMCRRLLNAIEMALSSLDIEMLVIPAISELTHTWTKVFGFKALEESHRNEMRSMNMMVFPGIDMLQKPLHKCDGNATADADVKVINLRSCHGDIIEVPNASLNALVASPNVLVSENGIFHDTSKAEKEAAAASDFHTLEGSNQEGAVCDDEPGNNPTTSASNVVFVYNTDAAPQDKPEVENQSLMAPIDFVLQSCNDEPGNKSMTSAPNAVAVLIRDTDVASEEKLEVENQSLMASVDFGLQFGGDSTPCIVQDDHNLSSEVGGVEPALHPSGVGSVWSKVTISESPDGFSVPSFQASPGRTVQNNTEWLVKAHETTSDASSSHGSDCAWRETPAEADITDEVKVDIAAEPIVYTFCGETAQCTSESIPQSPDSVCEYKLQASGCKPHDSGEGSIFSDKEGITTGVASVEPNQRAFGDAPVVCTLYC